MCLAVPGQITELFEDSPLTRSGLVDFDGIFSEVNLTFVPEADVGDYVVVHVGVAISMIDPDEAERVFEYLEEVGIMKTLEEDLEEAEEMRESEDG